MLSSAAEPLPVTPPSVTPPVRKICHVDLDAFYASVEQRDDPALRSRPLAVGGSRERGVVAAASYEARRFGVRSAMPSSQALRLCPELVFVKPRFEVYRAISRQIRGIYEAYTPLVEPLSLDEAYLDVTENLKGIPWASRIATEIRAAIRAETGLTASAGVSYNKFLAKLASDHRKPDGQFVITPEMGPGFVEGLEVARFHGVGPATAAKMHRLGIRTGRDLRERPLAFLQQHFGKAGAHFHAIARGEDDRPVRPDRPRRSSGSETTYPQDLTETGQVEAGVAALAAEVAAWCEQHRWFGRTVTVKLRYADFRTVTRSRTRPLPVRDREALIAAALELVRGLFPLRRPVRLLGVTVGAAEAEAGAQPSFDFGHPPPAGG
ncbi:DNA polymerase IV [Roseicella sp. DB1501]|nr:DNA polymerase IV [Roseicella sp. DB1501]